MDAITSSTYDSHLLSGGHHMFEFILSEFNCLHTFIKRIC